MKKAFIYFIFLVIAFLIDVTSVGAQTINENVTLTWPFGLGTAGQTATITPTVAEGYFSTNWTSIGSNLKYVDFRTSNSVTFTRFQPFIQNNSVTENDYVAFSFRPKTGLKFKPTSVSFDCQRYGTDGGKIDVVWKSTDGTLTTIATGVIPARDNSLTVTHASYDLSAVTIPESAGDCSLYIYIYSLGNTKQVGLANILINGNVQGTIQNIITHTFAATVFPENAGSVSNIPTGITFDQGTEISLIASRNFGYKFKEWRNSANDSLISSENPTKIILTSDLTVKAVFEQINTYSLKINLQGGAAPYMVSASPAGTIVGGQTVYEEGVNVTLTASNNDILTFTNWLSGETNPILTVPMTQNQEVTAMYTAVDYIVGWDFYKSGNNSRPADFFSTIDNETSNLILRKEDGTLNSWLDKSIVSANGYYVRGAAVNWKPLADKYYYQIHFNAKDFTDINVTAGMLFNYNVYSVQKCEYSLDNINFTTLGTYSLTAAQTWYDQTFNLPADANHAETVYVRWIPDYTSALIGTEALNNDGTSISNIYVKAKTAVMNDGMAPLVLLHLER
ncbi:MAG: InlB B-repeat-containing protein [Paludibacteraceae bacterium]